MFRLLVTGDRNWTNESVVSYALSLCPIVGPVSIMHGWARGLDTLVDTIGHEMDIFEILRRPSHWSHTDKKWIQVHGECPPFCKEVCGRAAGIIRNGAMLTEHQPHVLFAFHNDLSSSKGTKDMVNRVKRAKIPAFVFTEATYLEITPEMIDKVIQNPTSLFSF
jgi:hypothetical protein